VPPQQSSKTRIQRFALCRVRQTINPSIVITIEDHGIPG
jgi:hypothetical protein